MEKLKNVKAATEPAHDPPHNTAKGKKGSEGKKKVQEHGESPEILRQKLNL